MKITYRGLCEELYGKEIEVPDHECIDHLEYREGACSETHGLDCGPYETWTARWHECAVCHQQFDESELREMQSEAA